ncbi:MAG: myo-inositol-1(or 4)-monophosphatase [Candidatus Midichloriaceae bacterium]|jgi:myo-inositol-1(or 4)-monophosphatase
MKNFKADLNIVLEAVRKASVNIARDFYELENLQVSRKGIADFVTKTDLKTEKTLIYHLQKARPEYAFLTEESGEIFPESGNDFEYKWIIDPIDGTSNFMNSIPFFCISIALVKVEDGKQDVQLGVICNPISNEIFWAIKGEGAFVIDHMGLQKKARISKHDDFEKMLCATQDYFRYEGRAKQYMDYIMKKHCKIRIFGTSALELAYLSDARINIAMAKCLNVWDYAAGMLLVKESGGVITDFNHEPLTLINDNGIIAGSHSVIEDIKNNHDK